MEFQLALDYLYTGKLKIHDNNYYNCYNYSNFTNNLDCNYFNTRDDCTLLYIKDDITACNGNKFIEYLKI